MKELKARKLVAMLSNLIRLEADRASNEARQKIKESLVELLTDED